MSRINGYIVKIARCIGQYRADRLEPMGLAGRHLGYLATICRSPGISQDQLAQNMVISKSNVARQVAILEEQGFITRKCSETDKRVMELYPTEKTEQLYPRLQELNRQWDRMITSDLTQEEIETVTAILEKMQQKAVKWEELL